MSNGSGKRAQFSPLDMSKTEVIWLIFRKPIEFLYILPQTSSSLELAVFCGGNVSVTRAAFISVFVGCDVVCRRRVTLHPSARRSNHTLNAGSVDLAIWTERRVHGLRRRVIGAAPPSGFHGSG